FASFCSSLASGNHTSGDSVLVCLSLALVLSLTAGNANAQTPEFRIDGIAANPAAVHAGAGLTIPMGNYVRSGFDAGIGQSRHGISGRLDFVNRFHLDPFRQHEWALYAGGGLTARFDDNRSNRYYLLVFLGMDSPAKRGIATSVEAGLGGGARLGVILRKARAERR
ncbi:MAG TPA: hypothetical protein VF042_06590, partial [Gemmatimonadaceae bacterium]